MSYGLTLIELEVWRTLISQARATMRAPDLRNLDVLRRCAKRARSTVIPGGRGDPIRMRLFYSLIQSAEALVNNRDDGALVGLCQQCEAIVDPPSKED